MKMPFVKIHIMIPIKIAQTIFVAKKGVILNVVLNTGKKLLVKNVSN